MDAKLQKSGQKISNPLKKDWPKISVEDDTRVLTALKSIFEKYKNCLRTVKKAPKSAVNADKLTEEEEKQRQKFKSWMVLGTNSVLKGLEADTLSLVLVCSKTFPAVKEAVLSLAISRRCPGTCVTDLLSPVKPSWPGLSSLTAMGIKKSSDANDFSDLVQAVRTTIPQPNVPETPRLASACDTAIKKDIPDREDIKTEQEGSDDADLQEDCGPTVENTDSISRSLEDNDEVDPTKYYIYKSDQKSGSTFSGQDFLAFEKETSTDVYVNVKSGKVDICRDFGEFEVYGIAPPFCRSVGDDVQCEAGEDKRRERKRPAGSSSYKGIKIKQAKRDMSSAKQKRKQEKRNAKILNRSKKKDKK